MARRKAQPPAGAPAWMVTFADLMAVLMAFFVMVVAFSTQDQRKLQIVAGSMRDAFGVNPESRFSGIIEVEGIPTATHVQNLRDVPPEEATDYTTPNEYERRDEGLPELPQDHGFALATASLRQALQDMPEILEVSRNVIIEHTEEGLDISLIDQDGRSMFAEGAVQPYERTRRLLEAIAPVVRRMPNRVRVSGHTAVPRPGAVTVEDIWAITSGRAVVVRDILAANGLPNERFASVVGKGDTDPMFPDNPYIAPNRRVTITLLNEAPPLPPGMRF
jgi:chemotaxis protein MotB